MLHFLADESLGGGLLKAVRLRAPEIDILRVQDIGLSGAGDDAVLAWAAEHGRVVLTQDIRTFSDFAKDRVARGLAMPGVFVIKRSLPSATAIEEIVLAAHCCFEGEWEGRVCWLPIP